jgi:large subunit ribosomal protein L24
MSSLRIRTGDTVQVISGKDNGKQGEVLRVDPVKNRVYVQGLNMIKRHVRADQLMQQAEGETVSGIVESEGGIHISNVALLDPKDGKPTRVGVVRENGNRIRVAKRSGEKID